MPEKPLSRTWKSHRVLSLATLLLAIVLPSVGKAAPHEPRMSRLDNGEIRLGVDLSIGGAITWISKSDEPRNVINSADWGRQVQMSYYSGPVPFVVGDKRPSKFWEGLGWNPIQAGDDRGHGSKVLEHTNDGSRIYVKCRPMQWPLDNVPGDCLFESWLELDGSVVKARCRLSNERSDKTKYLARAQELPAIYTNGWLHRIVTYNGDQPFTGKPTSIIPPKGPIEGWTRWWATENWSALLADNDWGLGVVNSSTVHHIGGFNGKPGPSGEKDGACGYIAPTRNEILDHNIVHEYRYDLVLGTLEQIRQHAYKLRSTTALDWKFASDRQGWTLQGASDQRWPIAENWIVTNESGDARLDSPNFAARAEDARFLIIEAAFTGPDREVEVFWRTLSDPDFAASRSVRSAIVSDGSFREYHIPLGDSSDYTGLVLQLQVHPSNTKGASTRIRSIRLVSTLPTRP